MAKPLQSQKICILDVYSQLFTAITYMWRSKLEAIMFPIPCKIQTAPPPESFFSETLLHFFVTVPLPLSHTSD